MALPLSLALSSEMRPLEPRGLKRSVREMPTPTTDVLQRIPGSPVNGLRAALCSPTFVILSLAPASSAFFFCAGGDRRGLIKPHFFASCRGERLRRAAPCRVQPWSCNMETKVVPESGAMGLFYRRALEKFSFRARERNRRAAESVFSTLCRVILAYRSLVFLGALER